MSTVLIVDDHQLFAVTLAIALRDAGFDAEPMRPAPRRALLSVILGARPEVVLLDLDLGEYGDSTPLISPLTEAGIRVVVLTGLDDRLRIAAALERGAVAYRLKTENVDTVVATVRAVQAGATPLDPATRVALLEELRHRRWERERALAPFAQLTEREEETLRCVAAGHSVREIATAWVVSEATVRSHVRSLLAKLGVRSQLAAVALALRSGWLTPPDAAGSAGDALPVLDAAGGPAHRRHLHHHASPASRAVAGRLELAGADARGVVAVGRRPPAAVTEL